MQHEDQGMEAVLLVTNPNADSSDQISGNEDDIEEQPSTDTSGVISINFCSALLGGQIFLVTALVGLC